MSSQFNHINNQNVREKMLHKPKQVYMPTITYNVLICRVFVQLEGAKQHKSITTNNRHGPVEMCRVVLPKATPPHKMLTLIAHLNQCTQPNNLGTLQYLLR